jgi:hypothetical protein
LLNKGLKSYLNNFTIKMKAPVTQEEIDYRAELTNKINAISSIQGLFTDIEDKPRRLRILKALLAALNYGDELNAEIDGEIKALEEAAIAEGEDADMVDESGGEESIESDASAGDEDLGSLEAIAAESFEPRGNVILTEEQEFDTSMLLTEEDLPTPADLETDKDFSENN